MNHIRPKQELFDNNGYLDLTTPEMRTIGAFVMENERKNPNSKYLEVGIFGGGTIHFLKKHTKTTQFVGVDLFEDFVIDPANTHVSGTYKRDDVAEFLGDRVNLIKGDSAKVLNEINGKELFDFVFLDGNHSRAATQKDFELALKLMNPNSFMAFHNCSTSWEPDWSYVQSDGGPWIVCQSLKKSKDWVLVAEIDRLCVFYKK